MSKGKLFVISGPAGAGKGTLVNLIGQRLDTVWTSISATTRKPRGAEQEGVHYFFLSKEQFEETIQEGGFVEWACVHGNYYGTPVGPIQEHLDKGEAVILEIDVQGGFQVKEKFPDAVLVFILPPSLEVLEARLRGRGTDSEESIQLRMKNAVDELAQAKSYDCTVVNDDLNRATEELAKVINYYVGH